MEVIESICIQSDLMIFSFVLGNQNTQIILSTILFKEQKPERLSKRQNRPVDHHWGNDHVKEIQ